MDRTGSVTTASETAGRAALAEQEYGWYLYGITRPRARSETRPLAAGGGGVPAMVLTPESGDDEPVQMLECGDIAAVVRRVPLAEFGPEPLQARLGDPAWVEAIARAHNEVIAAIHRGQAILPAKFGCVYARAEDLTSALEGARDGLVAQLARVAGCDEWAVHLYADGPTVQQRLLAEHPSIERLQHDIAAARPGRAYLLRRKLDDELAAAAEKGLRDLAEAAYDRLARSAVAGQVSPLARPSPDAGGETEILRAAFLVPRGNREPFLAAVRSSDRRRAGLRCTSSGPWPPYSFAELTDRQSR